MFAISIDTDWAVQPLIDETAKLLNDFNIKATFFVTNKFDFKKIQHHELSIHPNFENNLDYEKVLKTCLNFLPTKKSKGTRSHRLHYNTTLPKIYEQLGIEYDSNYILPNFTNPKPFFIPNSNVLEIPFYFGDDQLFQENNFKISSISLRDSGVKVFMFHPFHIFMNTPSYEFYLKTKKYYKNFNQLEKNKNNSQPGIKDFFISFLEHIEKNDITTKTLLDINNEWRNHKKIAS